MEARDTGEDFERRPPRHRDLDEISGDLDALWREWRRLQAQPPGGEREDEIAR